MSTSQAPTPSPGTAVPGTGGAPSSPSSASSSPPAPTDVSQQIAQLTDAVNRLVQAQQAQRDALPRVAPGPDIGGELPGGEPLVAAVDHAKLSPLQQITLGLRDARPVGFRRDAVSAPVRRTDARDDQEDSRAAPSGAD